MMLLAVLVALFVSAAAELPQEPPLFSWDSVPVFMHSYVQNLSSPNRSGTAQYIARFSIVTMAGFAGSGGCCATDPSCCNEGRVTEFARAIKSAKGGNGTRVLYYQNTLINFPQTRLSNTVPESLLLHDKHGRLVYLGGCGSTHAAPNHTIYDHSLPAMRAAWADNVLQVVQDNKGLVDGVFCDRSGPITAVGVKDLGCYEFEEGRLRRWDEGHWQAVADTQAALSQFPTAIVIGNHASPQKSMHLHAPNSSWDAKMYEHWTPVKVQGMDYVPDGNQLAAFKHDGPNFIDEVHVDHCRVGSNGTGSLSDMYRSSLAAFLIGASEYSYYGCTNGWGFSDGWELWSDDYDRPLGPPLGPANRTATGWRRKFQSGTEVWLDIKDQTASHWGSSCIRWADGHVTQSGKLCRKGGPKNE